VKHPPDIHTNGSCSGSSTPSTISPGENTSLEDELSNVSFFIICFGAVSYCTMCELCCACDFGKCICASLQVIRCHAHSSSFVLFAHSAQYRCLIGLQCVRLINIMNCLEILLRFGIGRNIRLFLTDETRIFHHFSQKWLIREICIYGMYRSH